MLGYLDVLIGFAVIMLVISLLITILTQVASAMINHRGSNLRWGLRTLFANIDPKQLPNLTADADKVAEAVLTHCLVSDSWFSDNKFAQQLGKFPPLGKLFRRFQLATAIRPNELTAILRHLSTNSLSEDHKEVAADVRKLLGIAQVASAAATAAGQQGVANTIANTEKTATDSAERAVEKAEDAAERLQAWFSSMMDRVSQKFTMYMRIWTVAFAFFFAFGLGLNTMSLVSELYSNSTLRNSLVAAADQVMKSASEVLDSKSSLGARYSASLQQALKAAGANPGQPVPPAFNTPDEAATWVNQYVDEKQRAVVLTRFNTLAVTASRDAIQKSFTEANTLAALTAETGFGMLDFEWPWTRAWTWRGLIGVLATAGLLSLGAPFWFNALKTLTNLRPAIAQKQDAQQADAST
jgi:hypothetical protein